MKDTYNIKNISSLYNLPLYEPKKKELTEKSITKYLDTENDILILYHGKLGPGRGLKLLLESLDILPQNYKLIFLGNGVLQYDLESTVKIKNLENRVKFIPMVPEGKLIKFISGSHVGINILENINKSKWLASPNKLFQYIHAGIPVVCSKSPENIKVFERYNVGCLVENNPEDIAKGIEQVYDKMKETGFNELEVAAKHYSWKTEKDKLNSIVSKTISTS